MENKEKKEEKNVEESKKEKETKENEENKEKADNKDLKESKEGKEMKEKKITKESKDLLIKIINNTIKKRLDELEKRNTAENKTIQVVQANVEKIKSKYIFFIIFIINY